MNKIAVKKTQLAWAGVIGATLFVLIFTLEGWLRPGYDASSMYVSELSLGPGGWIQDLNFIVFGLLLLIFTRSVAAEFRSGKASRWGVILLTIVAICYLSFGFFVMDPVGTAKNDMTVHGLIHGLLGELVLVLMPVSCFVYLRRFREDAKWQFLQWWTLGLGIIIAAASVVLLGVMNFPEMQMVLNDWSGLIQRTSIVPFMVWIVIFAAGLIRGGRRY